MAPPKKSGIRSHATNLKEIRDAIAGGSLSNRGTALQDLVEFLKNPSSNQKPIKDKEYLAILEALFHAALVDKQLSLNTKKTGSSTAPGRLKSCAQAIRETVNHGVSRLKRKTVRALVDHITETLPNRDGVLSETMSQDYLQALVVLLSYPVHVESLAQQDGQGWLICVDFCVESTSRLMEGADLESRFANSPVPGTARTHSLARSSGRSGTAISQRDSGQPQRNTIQSLVQCLFALVSASNAPILERHREISSAVLRVLQLRIAVGPLQRIAFATLNSIVSQTAGDDPSLGRTLAKELVPLANHAWKERAGSQDEMLKSVRDEVLKALGGLHFYLDSLAQEDSGRPVLADVEDLLDTLWAEYSKRDARARLHLDDLTFSSVPSPSNYFTVDLFSLRPFHQAAEQKWALVEIIAILEDILQRHSRDHSQMSHDAEGEQPRKKRRVAADSSRIHQKMLLMDAGIRLTAIQLVPFLLPRSNLSAEDISTLVEDLVPLLGDKRGLLSSWAMIACASCAFRVDPKAEPKDVKWQQIWQLAIRSVSMPSTCRAACVLLHAILDAQLIPNHEIADDISNIVTMTDICGPAVVTDSSLVLMHRLAHVRNSLVPSSSQKTSSHIIRWTFTTWKPAQWASPSLDAIHTVPIDLVNLLSACCGLPAFDMPPQFHVPGGPLSYAWTTFKESASMIQYMLLLDGTNKHVLHRIDRRQPSEDDNAADNADSSSYHALKTLLLELLSPKLEEVSQVLDPVSSQSGSRRGSEGAVQLSVERLRGLVACLISTTMLFPQLENLDSRVALEVGIALPKLWDRVLQVILDSPQSQESFDMVMESIAPYIPPLDSTRLDTFCRKNPGLLNLFSKLSGALDEKAARQSSGHNTDIMDLDDEFESQSSQGSSLPKLSNLPRQIDALAMSSEAFYESNGMRLHLLSTYFADKSQVGLVPETLIDNLVSLTNEEFLLCRGFIREVLQSDLGNVSNYALPLVDKLGEVLGATEFSTCEVAQCTCIDILQGFAPIWSTDKQLESKIGDFYVYFLKEALPNNVLSPQAQISVANLMYRLIEINSQFYQTIEKMSSPRSSLLLVLENSVMRSKFSIGLRLPRIFELYVFKIHDELFVDILESLPDDPKVIEGIAFRIYVLAEIACKCPTLLRRCVYHIFETPGRVAQSAKYATLCLDKVSKARSLDSAQELFHLFAPQILYTWLKDDSIEEIPFGIFAFDSLEELIGQAQTEAAALMIMRGQEEALSTLAERLHLTTSNIAQQGFSKILAYAIAHDLSAPKEPQSSTAESRVRKVVGKEQFLECVYYHFADVIAILLDLIDQDDLVENIWRKDTNLVYAANIADEIKEFSHSPLGLPPNQQPMFKAKYLTREIAHLVGRTNYDVASLWTPPLVISVARKLLNTIHPALGPLHACSVVRKIRVLICLAGTQAMTSYPLEMLLHSVRPFISDVECAEDALGITQWLIANGSNHLAQVPSFFAGYAVSVLASLRVFLESSQASTTQESQFKATMSKVQHFHSWFVKFLSAYDSPAFKGEAQRQAFKSIAHSASNIRSSGNSEKDTHESNLLLAILKDGEDADRLLNESSRTLVLKMLCSDFKLPQSLRHDIMEADEMARNHSTVVWNTCRAIKSNKAYLTWVGQVVGRSFAATGEIPQDILRESQLSKYLKAMNNFGSDEGLLSLIATLTMADDSSHAGLAESALRNFISEAASQQDGLSIAACRRSMPETLYSSSDWSPYRTPPSDYPEVKPPDDDVFGADQIESSSWARNLALYLALFLEDSVILSVVPRILIEVDGFADRALAFIIHLVLLLQSDKDQALKRALSEATKHWLRSTAVAAVDNVKLLINCILYLRTQELPTETSFADRSKWLELDHSTIAAASARCGMFKVSLMFTELAFSESARSSRRSSAAKDLEDANEILLQIFESIDDPDAYYGLDQQSSLSNVLARLEYEGDGEKSLAFRGAQYDSHLRCRDPMAEQDGQFLVKSLTNLGLSGISHSLLQTEQGLEGSAGSLDSTFTNARRLQIWNLPAPPTFDNPAVTAYRAYQSVFKALDVVSARSAIQDGLASVMKRLTSHSFRTSDLRHQLGTLAALTELDEVLAVGDAEELEKALAKFETRSKWMMSGRYGDISQILSCRGTTLGMMSQKDILRNALKVTSAEARSVEIRSMLLSASIYRLHHATQESLNLSTSLTHLIKPSEAAGLLVDAAIRMEAANSLWDHNEMIPSIKMLQGIDRDSSFKKQSIPVSRSDLLSKISYQVSVARLEPPDAIQKKYLEPALKELKGKNIGKEAGGVFHQFAMFCDEQLQNPDSLDDLARLKRLMEGKRDEVKHYGNLLRNAADLQERARYAKELDKAKQWLSMDQQELTRAERTRDEFVRLCLENYLQSLTASDEHNNDALRFTALWLERSEETATNDAVRKYLKDVPTRKFAPLMNQLTSRLQYDQNPFQKLLLSLVVSICLDHPYHGMYQIWSGTKARVSQNDLLAVSRQKATKYVAQMLSNAAAVAEVWRSVDRTSYYFDCLAREKDEKRYKTGEKIAVKESRAAEALMNSLAKYHIPPPTLQLELSADKDYSRVPVIAKLDPTMRIAGGVNVPKIITMTGSDGGRYKLLVKGGRDDLRQDAVMEQVFSAVSSLLKQHRVTRQRNLGIRTYKVLPLTTTSGLIEFVDNTIPLHEWLMPAHRRYRPRDIRGSHCRKEITDAADRSIETRISVYRKVADRFRPVMRYFFLESFPDPDDWYVKRLAYTRSTAAISMLGHVLGLGDRHGHNILLDKETGEVVHIDLGVAFEMGRVLPVPEVVPFRLTRDIVDGMGITKTDGVFRRCCEFTLDALREDTYSIMTILDVLRYDPLYSWSISPVRVDRLQGAARRREEGDTGDQHSKEVESRKTANEASEADRALEVVRKKLSKTLSVTATVNDLINQASDERNLAVLYSGWAAYA